jgi:hypothetical protein
MFSFPGIYEKQGLFPALAVFRRWQTKKETANVMHLRQSLAMGSAKENRRTSRKARLRFYS